MNKKKKFSRTKLLMTSLVFAFLSLCCTEDFVDASHSFCTFSTNFYDLFTTLCFFFFFCLEFFLVSRWFSFVVRTHSLYLSFQLIYFFAAVLQVTVFFFVSFCPFVLFHNIKSQIIVGCRLNRRCFLLFYLFIFVCHGFMSFWIL